MRSSKPVPSIPTGFGTLTGTPEEVVVKLSQSGAERVIAVTLDHGTANQARRIMEALGSLAPFVAELVDQRQRETMERIVNALVPSPVPTANMLEEARMAARARSGVLESGRWLTAAQIAEVAGFSTSNPSAQPNRWKRDGRIFAIRHHGTDYYPEYALDPKTGYRPREAMARILGTFAGTKDEWAIAAWFASVNSFLGGRRPLDLLARSPGLVVAAAEDEVAEVAHG